MIELKATTKWRGWGGCMHMHMMHGWHGLKML